MNQVEHRLKTGFVLISGLVFVQPEVGVNAMTMMMDKIPGKSLKVDQGAGSVSYLGLVPCGFS